MTKNAKILLFIGLLVLGAGFTYKALRPETCIEQQMRIYKTDEAAAYQTCKGMQSLEK